MQRTTSSASKPKFGSSFTRLALIAVLCTLLGLALSFFLPDSLLKDFLIGACGLGGLVIVRSGAAVSLSASAEQERVLRNRLSLAMKAARNEGWEMDLISGKMVWLENRLPGIGLVDVPLENCVSMRK